MAVSCSQVCVCGWVARRENDTYHSLRPRKGKSLFQPAMQLLPAGGILARRAANMAIEALSMASNHWCY